MPAGPPEHLGQLMSPAANANDDTDTASLLASNPEAIDASQRMTEMEHVFRPAGNAFRQMAALATLRRWQSDPRLDRALRERASALVWKFQPNGWDEV